MFKKATLAEKLNKLQAASNRALGVFAATLEDLKKANADAEVAREDALAEIRKLESEITIRCTLREQLQLMKTNNNKVIDNINKLMGVEVSK